MVYIPTRKNRPQFIICFHLFLTVYLMVQKNSITVLIYLNIFLLSNNQLVLLSDKTYLTKLIAQVML